MEEMGRKERLGREEHAQKKWLWLGLGLFIVCLYFLEKFKKNIYVYKLIIVHYMYICALYVYLWIFFLVAAAGYA